MKQNRPTDGLVLMLLHVQPCLSSNNLPQLPITIANSIPHIIVLLGTSDSAFTPAIPAIIDTGAALNCAYHGYIMPIAKAYPELVKSITLCNDRYSPIVLSGVINKDDRNAQKSCTNLPAIVGDATRLKVTNLVKKYLCCFVEENVKIPIRNYECVIDTGDHMPLSARNIRYGLHETPIMQKAIDSLLHNDQICIDGLSWPPNLIRRPSKISPNLYDDFA
jgi:hypothetical protein